jgi:hypothetical protein
VPSGICPYDYTICTGYFFDKGVGCCDWDPSCPCYFDANPSLLNAQTGLLVSDAPPAVTCGIPNAAAPTFGCSLGWLPNTNFFPEYGHCGYYAAPYCNPVSYPQGCNCDPFSVLFDPIGNHSRCTGNFPINRQGASGLSINMPDRIIRHVGAF